VHTAATTSTVRLPRRLLLAASLGLLLVIALASAALAQDSALGGKFRAGQEVVVPAGSIVDGDLYASGGIVRVEGTVDGDLIVWAGQVQITGDVTGDVMAAGGTIGLDGDVDGDVRVAGGRVATTGAIGEDLLVGGGQVRLASSTVIGEDLVFGTGEMTLEGTVTGDVLGSTGAYVNQGTIGGTENVTISEPEERRPTAVERVLDVLGRLVSVLLLAALALLLAPRLVEGPARTLRSRAPMSGLIGLAGVVAVIIGVPVLLVVAGLLAVALAFVGLGDLVGLIVLAVVAMLVLVALVLTFVFGFGAPAIVGMTLGDFLVPSNASRRRWWALILGVTVVVIASALPIVGGWIVFFVALFGFGALLLDLLPWERTPSTGAPVPDAPPAGTSSADSPPADTSSTDTSSDGST
jgi:hypothetical protein